MLSRVVKHIEFRRRQAKYPHMINSHAWHPEMVHPTAIVRNTSISGQVRIAEYAQIEGPVSLYGEVTIGPYTTLSGPNTDVFSYINPIKIGAFCSIANCVAIRENNHPTDRCSTYYVLSRLFGERQEAVSKGAIIIGNDVWIATQCVILSGARIGTGAIIGANSVVTSEIPPYAIAVGSPARVIKSRFPEPMVARLLASEWWDWPRERILRNRPLFDGELTMEKLDAIRD